MDAYAPEIERVMKRLYDSLGEKDRRRYEAVEATNPSLRAPLREGYISPGEIPNGRPISLSRARICSGLKSRSPRRPV